jgi:TonB family protein
MQSTMLRLAVALVAFGLGIGATMLWIAYRTPDVATLQPSAHLAPPAPSVAPIVVMNEPPPPPSPPRPLAAVLGGLLNNKAISKPAPAYPAIAKAARASGQVFVQVTLDETGRVISAKAVSGHPLLQQAAVEAAYQARFSPTLLSGQPVKVTGNLSYSFAPQ